MLLASYARIALRTLRKQKGYAFINVFGLAVGMACCLLMLAFVRNEWSYDRFHAGADRIFRVDIRSVTPEGGVEVKAGQPVPLAPAMTAALPEVEQAVRLRYAEAVVGADGTETFPEQVLFADAAFFDLFTFPLVRGDAATALADPSAVVLTTEAADKYFGTPDVVGRRLRLSFGGAFEDFVVRAVASPPPPNTSIRFGVVLPFERWPSYRELETAWTSWATNTYVRLADAQAAGALAARLPAFTAEHYAPMIQTARILGWIGEGDDAFRLVLHPLPRVHFLPEVQQAQSAATDPVYPLLLAGLALAVLLIACINFTTLAVGRAARRAKEVGLRKVLGAVRRQLVAQFWGEALLMSTFALLLGVGLAELFLPVFNGMTGSALTLDFLWGGRAVVWLGALALGTGLVAGAYPAVFLSRFQPAAALRQQARAAGRNRWMQGLVVLQFALSIAFIVGVVVVSAQLHYLKTKHPGLSAERLVAVETHSQDVAASERLVEAFRNALAGRPEVVRVAGAATGLDGSLSWSSYTSDEGPRYVYKNRVDAAFLETLGIELAAGRAFSDAMPGDRTQSVLVNEALVKDFGWTDAVGKKLDGFGVEGTGAGGVEDPTVVGVVKDYHFQSLHHAVAPMVLMLGSSMPYQYVYVRLAPGDPAAALAVLEAAWQRLAPDRPFRYAFVDEAFDRQYRAEEQWQRIIAGASAFAVLIACLGLFGLSAFTAERRTKEVGIRKVMGASVPGLVALLSRDFVVLVAVAFVVAAPVAYLGAARWLEGFAYRIEIGPGVFVLAGALALATALATVAYQALRAALADPVKSLRYE